MSDKQYRKRPSKKLSVPQDWDTLIISAKQALEANGINTGTYRKGSAILSESAVVEAALRYLIQSQQAVSKVVKL